MLVSTYDIVGLDPIRTPALHELPPSSTFLQITFVCEDLCRSFEPGLSPETVVAARGRDKGVSREAAGMFEFLLKHLLDSGNPMYSDRMPAQYQA